MLIPPIWNHYANHHHFCDNVSFKSIEAMVAGANERNGQADVTGILLLTGRIFQLIEGLKKRFRIFISISAGILATIIWWSCFAIMPSRRFGKVGMELFDLREHDREVLRGDGPGTSNISSPMMTGRCNFPYFCRSHRKANYFEIPSADSWVYS